MPKNCYIIASKKISITTRYNYFHKASLNHLCVDSADDIALSICSTAEDVQNEQNLSKTKNFDSVYASSPAYLESLAIQRKLSEALIDYDTILFHSSALAVDGQGYLFAALSGTGKSTHSRLWREMYGDRVTMINDDKPFIHVGEDEVRVYGSPWNGKHHLGTNTSVPVKAICILTRDTTNHIERIKADEAFAILYQQTYRSKDPAKLAHTIDLITRMADKVSLYRLGCNMDPDAARVSYEGMNDE